MNPQVRKLIHACLKTAGKQECSGFLFDVRTLASLMFVWQELKLVHPLPGCLCEGLEFVFTFHNIFSETCLCFL